MPPYSYIEARELANLIKSGAEAGKDYQVVDVRDDDYDGGSIPGAIHAPSHLGTEESVQALVVNLRNVPRVVFLCSLSQIRGPKAARIYAAELERQRALLPLDPPSSSEASTDHGASSSDSNGPPASSADPRSLSPNPFAAKTEHQEVLVLRKGFTAWQALYRDDPTLVQQFDRDVWGSAAP